MRCPALQGSSDKKDGWLATVTARFSLNLGHLCWHWPFYLVLLVWHPPLLTCLEDTTPAGCTAASHPKPCVVCIYSLLCFSQLKGKGNSCRINSCWNITSLFVWKEKMYFFKTSNFISIRPWDEAWKYRKSPRTTAALGSPVYFDR